MSAVTSHVTALSAKVALSRKSRVQLSARAPARAPARSGLVCKAEVTNGNGAFRVASRFRRHRCVSRRVSRAYLRGVPTRTDAAISAGIAVASASFPRSVRPSSDRRAPLDSRNRHRHRRDRRHLRGGGAQERHPRPRGLLGALVRALPHDRASHRPAGGGVRRKAQGGTCRRCSRVLLGEPAAPLSSKRARDICMRTHASRRSTCRRAPPRAPRGRARPRPLGNLPRKTSPRVRAVELIRASRRVCFFWFFRGRV